MFFFSCGLGFVILKQKAREDTLRALWWPFFGQNLNPLKPWHLRVRFWSTKTGQSSFWAARIGETWEVAQPKNVAQSRWQWWERPAFGANAQFVTVRKLPTGTRMALWSQSSGSRAGFWNCQGIKNIVWVSRLLNMTWSMPVFFDNQFDTRVPDLTGTQQVQWLGLILKLSRRLSRGQSALRRNLVSDPFVGQPFAVEK